MDGDAVGDDRLGQDARRSAGAGGLGAAGGAAGVQLVGGYVKHLRIVGGVPHQGPALGVFSGNQGQRQQAGLPVKDLQAIVNLGVITGPGSLQCAYGVGQLGVGLVQAPCGGRAGNVFKQG